MVNDIVCRVCVLAGFERNVARKGRSRRKFNNKYSHCINSIVCSAYDAPLRSFRYVQNDNNASASIYARCGFDVACENVIAFARFSCYV